MWFRIAGLSTRIKYILIIVMTLLPLSAILLFITLSVYLPTFASMEEVVNSVVTKVMPVNTLQHAILASAMPPNDYLISGAPEEKTRFEAAAADVEMAFDEIKNTYAGNAESFSILTLARRDWANVRKEGEALLALPNPKNNPSAVQAMEHFDSRISKLVTRLNQIHDQTQIYLEDRHAEIQTMKDRGFLNTALALLASLILGLTGVIFLTREHDTLQQKAMKDQLTGAYNRRACDERLAEAAQHSLTFEDPAFSLLMLDIDHFKAVNDTHGHQTGDEALKYVAKAVKGQLRASDFLGRYGGEEFQILLPNANAEQAADLANRVREAVGSVSIAKPGGGAFKVTLSIGLSEFPADTQNADELVAKADAALYHAKEMGRNRVEIYANLPEMA